jgi:hypothetical protein
MRLTEEDRLNLIKEDALAKHEVALRECYQIWYELKGEWESGIPMKEHLIPKMAMVKAKITIIKKKIRDL